MKRITPSAMARFSEAEQAHLWSNPALIVEVPLQVRSEISLEKVYDAAASSYSRFVETAKVETATKAETFDLPTLAEDAQQLPVPSAAFPLGGTYLSAAPPSDGGGGAEAPHPDQYIPWRCLFGNEEGVTDARRVNGCLSKPVLDDLGLWGLIKWLLSALPHCDSASASLLMSNALLRNQRFHLDFGGLALFDLAQPRGPTAADRRSCAFVPFVCR